MQVQGDITLLQQYARTGSEAAFEDLVSRYVGLVYAAAMRQVRNPAIAEEITQAVFVILARKAGRLSDRTLLSGWLFKTTRFVAMAEMRASVRRRRYEQEAHMESNHSTETDANWDQIAPLLDEALASLGEKDRQALLLRFFENQSLAAVGSFFGTREDAARMRINRALEKLRRYFLKRRVTATTGVIASALSANAVQAAPPALAKTITAVVVTKGAAAGASLALVKGALKLMAWTKAKTTIVVGACVLLATGTTTTIAVYSRVKPVQGIPKDWSVLQGSSDQWNWAEGRINASSTNGSTLLASSKRYTDFTLSVAMGTTNRDADLALRMLDAEHGYYVLFVPQGTPWAAENGAHVSLIRKIADEEVTLASYHGRRLSAAGQSATITAKAKGPLLEVSLNGVTVLQARDTTFSSGLIGLRICGDTTKPCHATFSGLSFH